MRRCGPMDVTVCPYLQRGAFPLYSAKFQLIVFVFKIVKYSVFPLSLLSNLFPDSSVQPPKKTISGPDIEAVWPYLGLGGVPETLKRDQTKVSVSRILRSFK